MIENKCKTCVYQHNSIDYCACCTAFNLYKDMTTIYFAPNPELPGGVIRKEVSPPKLLNIGLKYDSGKPPISRIPRTLLEEVAKVLAFGASKYDWNNWRNGIQYHRLLDAAMRHLTAFADNETIDPESGISHLAHAACCISFLLEFESLPERYKEFDDRHSYLLES